jgi:hypothetical protein
LIHNPGPGHGRDDAGRRAESHGLLTPAKRHRAGRLNHKEEEYMAGYSGDIRVLYGPTIRDKAKTADLGVLQAYRTVANDLLNDASGADADDLKSSIGDLDKSIKAKGG